MRVTPELIKTFKDLNVQDLGSVERAFTQLDTKVDTINQWMDVHNRKQNPHNLNLIEESHLVGYATPNASADTLVLVNNGDAGLTIVSPDANAGSIYFGDVSYSRQFGFVYDHNTDTFAIKYVTVNEATWSSTAGWVFNAAQLAGDDFTIYSQNSTATFVVDSSADSVGVGTATPAGKLHVYTGDAGAVSPHTAADEFVIESNGATFGMSFLGSDTAIAYIAFGDPTSNTDGQIRYYNNGGTFELYAAGTIFMQANSTTSLIFNANYGAMDTIIGGDTDPYLVYADASADFVGIGINTPEKKFHVAGDIMLTNAKALFWDNAASTTPLEILELSSSDVFVFNETGANIDFRFEGDTDTALLFVDAGADFVGIGTATPESKLNIYTGSAGTVSPAATALLTLEAASASSIQFLSPATNAQYIYFGSPTSNSRGYIQYNHANDSMVYASNGSVEYMRFGTGDIYFNRQNNSIDFRVSTVNQNFTLFVDASADAVGIQTNTPSSVLHVASTTSGLLVGATPTGGDLGAGTINVSTNIYKNNTAYTNPDFVLEHWARGTIEKYKNRPRAKDYVPMSVYEVEEYARKHWRLPGITDEPAGVFDMTDISLELIERLYIHVFDLQHQLDELRGKHED